MPQIRAPITGILVHLPAAVGDTVSEGDLVAVIESMKLEIPVEADVAGTVSAMHATVGSAVAEGDALVTVS